MSGTNSSSFESSAVGTSVDARKPVAANDPVHGREPMPREHPSEEQPTVESPPLHDDRYPQEGGERIDKPRAGFLRRHPFAVSLGLLLLIPVAAAGYLYWDNARHFE